MRQQVTKTQVRALEAAAEKLKDFPVTLEDFVAWSDFNGRGESIPMDIIRDMARAFLAQGRVVEAARRMRERNRCSYFGYYFCETDPIIEALASLDADES